MIKEGPVTVLCDRCIEVVYGLEFIDATSGFYRSSHTGGPWDKYMEPNETVLCDNCMHHDIRYESDYGKRY